MEFGMVSISLLVVAAGLVLLGLKLLFATGWFVHFLRGFGGFGLIAVAAVIVMVGLNLTSYAQLEEKQDLANVSFSKLNEQSYEATVVSVNGGVEYKFTVEGDMWQINSRVLKLAASSTPFYKLDSISGRYYSLEQQRSSAQSVSVVPDTGIGLDLWTWFKNKNVGLIVTSLQKSQYLPMADGAVYSVSAGENGLQSAPVNEAAKSIDNEWQ